MAPELFGVLDNAVSTNSDIYALAMVVIEVGVKYDVGTLFIRVFV